MFDQTFSPENLKYIFDIENRKGEDLFKELDDPEFNLLLTEKRNACALQNGKNLSSQKHLT